MKNIERKVKRGIKQLNDSKVFAGLALVVMNIASKHVDVELTPAQKEIFKHTISKQLLIFAIAWVGSKDVLVSLLITIGYLVVFELLLNSKSRFNILPEKLKRLENAIDLNNDGKIQPEELDKALELIKKYKEENKNKSK